MTPATMRAPTKRTLDLSRYSIKAKEGPAKRQNTSGKGMFKAGETRKPLEEQKSLDLQLFEFLQKSNAQKEYSTFHRMFNTPLKLFDIMDQHKHFVEDEFEFFRQMTIDGRIVNKYEAFVHIRESENLRYHLSRRFDGLPDYFKGLCTLHKRGCKISEERFAFAMYLHYVELGVSEQSTQEHDLEEYEQKEEELTSGQNEELQDEEHSINLEEEKVAIATFDLISLKSEALRDAVTIDKIELDSSSYAVSILPSFKIEGGEYVLLDDILCIFNLREDYALGLIAQSCKVDKEVMIDYHLLELEDKFNSALELLCDLRRHVIFKR